MHGDVVSMDISNRFPNKTMMFMQSVLITFGLIARKQVARRLSRVVLE